MMMLSQAQPVGLPRARDVRLEREGRGVTAASRRLLLKGGVQRQHVGAVPTAVLVVAKTKSSNRGNRHTEPTASAKPWFDQMRVGVSSLAAAVTVFSSSISPALSTEAIEVKFDAPATPAVLRAQMAMIEAWAIVRETFYDATFNNNIWEEVLADSLEGTLEVEDPAGVYSVLDKMVDALGDPFTRVVNPVDFKQFQTTSEGELMGIGVVIGQEEDSDDLVVLGTVRESPAERAGIQAGDKIVYINNTKAKGLDPIGASELLRGRAGTTVQMRVRRGVASANVGKDMIKNVKIRREKILLNPMVSKAYQHEAADGSIHTIGYMHLYSFSEKASSQMMKTIQEFEAQGVDEYILDLRDNPGGLVEEGLNVASLWLNGGDSVVQTVGRDEDPMEIRIGQESRPLTEDPLIVLVNENSASASEIVAGALLDNGRAQVMGNTQTYGKGRIQSVYELQDGSGLFVTVAMYRTPVNHTIIDKVGITPTSSCKVPKVGKWQDNGIPLALIGDECVMAAEAKFDLDANRL